MAPPPSSMASRVVTLVLRVLTFIFLLISLIVITTNTTTVEINFDTVKLRFNDVYAYRYMLATIVFGFSYTLLQIAFTLYHVSTGNHVLNGDGSLLFDFYGDKVISFALATGAAAGFGVTKDLMAVFTQILGLDVDGFSQKAYASASLLFLGFVCTAILSVFSSYALPKKV